MNNKLYRDKSFDENLDRKINLTILKTIIAWALPMIILMIGPLMLFDDIKVIGSTANSIYSWYLIICLILYCIYISKWCKNNIYILSNFKLYFIKDEKNNLYFSYLNNGGLGNYFRNNVKLDKKIKYSPFLLIYSFIFFIGTYGARKITFLKTILYFKINQKEQYAEKLLTSENFKTYCTSIYSIKNIKEFYKGIEFDAEIVGEVNGRRHFTIYNTTENYQELCSLIYSYIKDYELESDTRIIGTYERKILNKISFRKIRAFILCSIVLVICFVMRYISYLDDRENGFILKQYMARRHKYFMKYILVGWGFFFIKDFLVTIWDLIGNNTFKCTEVKIDKIYENKSIINKIFDGYSKYVYITYNNKSMKLGTTNDFNSNIGLLIIKNNKPYCVINADENNI